MPTDAAMVVVFHVASVLATLKRHFLSQEGHCWSKRCLSQSTGLQRWDLKSRSFVYSILLQSYEKQKNNNYQKTIHD